MSPALAGRFFRTEPSGKPPPIVLKAFPVRAEPPWSVCESVYVYVGKVVVAYFPLDQVVQVLIQVNNSQTCSVRLSVLQGSF